MLLIVLLQIKMQLQTQISLPVQQASYEPKKECKTSIFTQHDFPKFLTFPVYKYRLKNVDLFFKVLNHSFNSPKCEFYKFLSLFG